jgi:hypothetical protein
MMANIILADFSGTGRRDILKDSSNVLERSILKTSLVT